MKELHTPTQLNQQEKNYRMNRKIITIERKKSIYKLYNNTNKTGFALTPHTIIKEN